MMELFEFFDIHPWVLPLVIFFGRICDVTLGTLRIIFVAKGERAKAPIVGFFEVFIWVVIISQLLTHANSLITYAAYAAGYAAGNYVGILVENKIAFGYQMYRIYTKKNAPDLTKLLNKKGIGSTYIKGHGAMGEISIVETVVGRKNSQVVVATLGEFDPEAFYYIEDIRSKQKGIFAATRAGGFPRIGK